MLLLRWLFRLGCRRIGVSHTSQCFHCFFTAIVFAGFCQYLEYQVRNFSSGCTCLPTVAFVQHSYSGHDQSFLLHLVSEYRLHALHVHQFCHGMCRHLYTFKDGTVAFFWLLFKRPWLCHDFVLLCSIVILVSTRYPFLILKADFVNRSKF